MTPDRLPFRRRLVAPRPMLDLSGVPEGWSFNLARAPIVGWWATLAMAGRSHVGPSCDTAQQAIDELLALYGGFAEPAPAPVPAPAEMACHVPADAEVEPLPLWARAMSWLTLVGLCWAAVWATGWIVAAAWRGLVG